jgi:hypothetical protein
MLHKLVVVEESVVVVVRVDPIQLGQVDQVDLEMLY